MDREIIQVTILGIEAKLMSMTIRELRDSTGLSQKQFADRFSIPVSTLRKWEQGESKPAAYLLKLLAEMIPVDNNSLKTIVDREGNRYFYNELSGIITDASGRKIKIETDLEGVKAENLPLYVHDLFESYYEMLDKFDRDCEYDKKVDIIWS